MKIYYSPGACSLSPHIALEEAGIPYEAIKVDLKAKKTEKGDDFLAINPKGKVPYLATGSGDGLSEGAAIVQYIADQAPNAKLAPANGTMERYKLQELLNFIASEVHKGFAPFFNPAATDEVKAATKANLTKQFGFADAKLAGNDYLMGKDFSVADAYLYVMSRWAAGRGIDTANLKNFEAWKTRVAERPKVKAALMAEGLLKAA